MKLRDLKPGEMFRRPGGSYRYSVSNTKEECSSGEPTIYCYNHDGKSLGYFFNGNSEVVRLIPPENQEEEAPPTSSIFWMCFVEGGGSPTYKHLDYYLAVHEAEKLALRTDKRVHLLQSISSVVYVQPTAAAGYNWRNEC